MSGYDDFEYAKSGIEDGIVAYLLKPISMTELTAELEKRHVIDHKVKQERMQ